jgi:hypothetical protein
MESARSWGLKKEIYTYINVVDGDNLLGSGEQNLPLALASWKWLSVYTPPVIKRLRLRENI